MHKLSVWIQILGMCVLLSACQATVRTDGFFTETNTETARQEEPAGQNRELQAELAKQVTVSEVEEAADEYGRTLWKATVTMPDYSRMLSMYRTEAEAEAKDTEEFEEKILKLVQDYMQEMKLPEQTAKDRENSDKRTDGGWMIDREIHIDASQFSGRAEDREQLKELFKNAAVEAELEEFAMDILTEHALKEGVFTSSYDTNTAQTAAENKQEEKTP